MKMVDFWSIFLYMRLAGLDLAYSVGWRHSLGVAPYRGLAQVAHWHLLAGFWRPVYLFPKSGLIDTHFKTAMLVLYYPPQIARPVHCVNRAQSFSPRIPVAATEQRHLISRKMKLPMAAWMQAVRSLASLEPTAS